MIKPAEIAVAVVVAVVVASQVARARQHKRELKRAQKIQLRHLRIVVAAVVYLAPMVLHQVRALKKMA